MKPIYFLLIGLLYFQTTNAQTWIEKGATWHYNWVAMSGIGFDKIHYEKDTTIAGKTCQQLSVLQYEFGADQNQQIYLKNIRHLQNQYTYLSDDTVFYLLDNQFHVLYNFTAMPKDSWLVGTTDLKFKCTGSGIMVDSIGTTTINSKSYRWMTLKPLPNSNALLSGKVNERFGAMDGYLFPTQNACDTSIAADLPQYYFSCFEDDSFASYNVTGKDCEYLLKSSVNAVHSDGNDLQIYPNPSHGNINISNPGSITVQIEIFNLTGQLEKHFMTDKNTVILDISDLSYGLYLFKIEDNSGKVSFRKIVLN